MMILQFWWVLSFVFDGSCFVYTRSLRPGVPDSLFSVRMSRHGLGLKKEEKKQNIDPVFNSSAVLFVSVKEYP
jgi:hypothetical protein